MSEQFCSLKTQKKLNTRVVKSFKMLHASCSLPLCNTEMCDSSIFRVKPENVPVICYSSSRSIPIEGLLNACYSIRCLIFLEVDNSNTDSLRTETDSEKLTGLLTKTIS